MACACALFILFVNFSFVSAFFVKEFHCYYPNIIMKREAHLFPFQIMEMDEFFLCGTCLNSLSV